MKSLRVVLTYTDGEEYQRAGNRGEREKQYTEPVKNTSSLLSAAAYVILCPASNRCLPCP